MCKVCRWLTLVVVGVLVAQLSAMAADEQNPWKLSLTIKGANSDNRDATKSDKENNFDTIVEPRVEASLDMGNTKLDFYYAPYLIWRSNPRDDQNDVELYHGLSVGVDHKVSARVALLARELFEYTDDPKVTEGGTTVRENASYMLNRVTAGGIFGLAPKTSAVLNGDHSLKRYDKSAMADYADEDRYGADLSLKYAVTPDMNATVEAGYSAAMFEGIERDSAVQTYGVGVEKTFNPNLYGTVVVGYQNASMDNAKEDSVGSPTVAARVTCSPATPATRLTLSGSYSLEPPDLAPYSIQERTKLQVAVEHDINALTLGAAATYANGKYDEDSVVEDMAQTTSAQAAGAGTAAVFTGGDDTLMDAALSATYKINRNLSVGVAYEYEDWDSDVRESFSRNVVSVSVRGQL